MKKLSVLLSAVFLLSAACSRQSPVQNQASQPVSVPAQSQTQQSNMANWKIYVNSKSGYQFSYPGDWAAYNSAYNDGSALFGPGATSQSGIAGVQYLGQLKSGQSLKDFVSTFNQGVEAGSTSEVQATISSKPVIISILPMAGIPRQESKSAAFDDNGKVFGVYINYHSDISQYPTDQANLDIFNQILSTFKFTK